MMWPFSLLRSRVTFKYVALFVPIALFLRSTLTGMPLLSSPLPKYTGKYEVGTIDLEATCMPRMISDAIFKKTQEPAFKLETVFFTLYYPSQPDSLAPRPKHKWIPRPITLIAEGYAKFAKLDSHWIHKTFAFFLWLLAGSTEIPAMVDAPLRRAGGEKHPIVVFSHGMAGMPTSYSQYCGELASRGYVVAIIEHRDGSGPGSMVIGADRSERRVFHARVDELESKHPLDKETLKKNQLAFRQVEVEETVRVLRALNGGKGAELFHDNPRHEGVDLEQWEGHLDIDSAFLAGHSYGATLALQALESAPMHARPFKGGIALDPGKQSGPLNHDINVPLLIINSENWSRGKLEFYGQGDYFDVVKNLVHGVIKRGKDAWFMTLLGTAHPSCTDAPLIEPLILKWATGTRINPIRGMMEYVQVSADFMDEIMDGKRRGFMANGPSHPKRPGEGGDERRTEPWLVHVAPDARVSKGSDSHE